MSTPPTINYPVEGTLLFSDTLTIHYKLAQQLDLSVAGIEFVLDENTALRDTELDGIYTITDITEGDHVLRGYLINSYNKKISNTDFDIRFTTDSSTLSVENKLTHVLKSTIPTFIKEDYPNFVAFLKAYYEWSYSSNNPFYAPLAAEDFKDIDKTPDYFIKYFKEQYLGDFPESLTTDKQTGTPIDVKTLIKNIVDFYSAKGTEKSIKFLLTILYDSYSEIYYPKRDIFKASDSTWNQRSGIKFTFSTENIHQIKSQRMYQENGGTITSVANINDLHVYRAMDHKQIAEVFYSNVEGTFNFTKPFKVNLENEIVELTPVVIVNSLEINDGGLNYQINDKITIKRLIIVSGLLEDIAIARVVAVDTFGTITQVEFVNFGVSYLPLGFDSDGNIIESESILYFDSIDSDLGSGADIGIGTGFIANYAGYWTNKNSHPDTIKRIADNKRFQEFSYVVRTNRTLDKYAEVLRKLAHPAGMELLGDVLIQNTILQPTLNEDLFTSIFSPLIGNYSAYRLDTVIDVRNGATLDLYPNGFDPTTINPQQDGTDVTPHEISTNGRLDDLVNQTTFSYIPDVSDNDQINNYWVIYPHPNTEINSYDNNSSFLDLIIKDFVKQEKE